MTIRHATFADYAAVVEIQRWAELPPNYPYQFAENIGARGVTNLVYEVDGQVVGFVTVLHRAQNPQGRSMWERLGPYVGFVSVLPAFRGAGRSPALLRQAREELRTLGFTQPIWLECEPESREQRSHATVGFEMVDADVVEGLTGMRPRVAVMRWA